MSEPQPVGEGRPMTDQEWRSWLRWLKGRTS